MITAAQAREMSSKIRDEITNAAFTQISKQIQQAIDVGETEKRISFNAKVKIEVLRKLEELGYKPVGSSNIDHTGKCTIKISW